MTPEEFILQEEGASGRQKDGSYESVWDKIGGVWTIGPGITQGVKRGTRWSRDETEARFHQELASFEKAVDSEVKLPINENQRAVLVSFAYNVGEGAFKASSVLALVNKGFFSVVPSRLALYVHGRGVKGVVPGLVNRRAAEIKLWNTPIGSPPPLPINLAGMPVPKAASYAQHLPKIPSMMDIVGYILGNIIVGTSAIGGIISKVVNVANTPSLPSPTVSVPVTQTPLIISQLGTFLRGVAKIVGGGLLGVVSTHWNEIQSLANETNFWLGAAMVVIGQTLSQWKVAESNALTLAALNQKDGVQPPA